MFVFLHCVITEVWSQVFSAASCQGSCKDKNKSPFHVVQENNAHSPAAVFTQSFLEVVCKICKSKDTLKQQALSKCFSNQTFQTERLHDHVKVIRSDRMTTQASLGNPGCERGPWFCSVSSSCSFACSCLISVQPR